MGINTQPTATNSVMESVTDNMALYPVKEVAKYVENIHDVCVFEIQSGFPYIAVIGYAEAHFKDVGCFSVNASQRKDTEGEDALGVIYQRFMGGRRNRFDLAASVKKKGSKTPELNMYIGTGTFAHEFNGKTIYLCHFLRDKVVSGPHSPAMFRRAVLFAEGKSLETKKLLEDFTSLCLEWHHHKTFDKEPSENKFRLFRFKVCHGSEWAYEGEKRSRNEASVVLKKNMQEEILNDFSKFLSEKSKAWYQLHGVPRRRCYLFYGEPGSGKTSMIKVIAGKFKLNACFLSLASQKVDNQTLNDAISTLPSEALLVLEDVDTLFDEDKKSKEGIHVTYSSLLQVLDGLPSGEGRLTVMTTNHVEKLQTSMIRCGRVDRMFHIGAPDKEQVEAYFTTFFPECSRETRRLFSDSVMSLDRPEKKSIATLQNFFIFTMDDSAEVAVSKLDEFYEKYFEARLPKTNAVIYS